MNPLYSCVKSVVKSMHLLSRNINNRDALLLFNAINKKHFSEIKIGCKLILYIHNTIHIYNTIHILHSKYRIEVCGRNIEGLQKITTN